MLQFPPDLGLNVPLTVTHCPLWVGRDILSIESVSFVSFVFFLMRKKGRHTNRPSDGANWCVCHSSPFQKPFFFFFFARFVQKDGRKMKG